MAQHNDISRKRGEHDSVMKANHRPRRDAPCMTPDDRVAKHTTAMDEGNGRSNRVLLILGGAAVMQLSPGSHEHVKTMCASDGWLASARWFCSLDPAHRVGLCVSVVSTIFLADVICSCAWRTRNAFWEIARLVIAGLRHTNRDTAMARAREARRAIVAVGGASRGLLKYIVKAARFTLRALGFRIKAQPQAKSQAKSIFWPTSLVKQARDQWRAAFERYSRTSSGSKRSAGGAPRRAPKKRANAVAAASATGAAPVTQKEDANDYFDLRQALLRPPENLMHEGVDEDELCREEDETTRGQPPAEEAAAAACTGRDADTFGWEESKGWEEVKSCPEEQFEPTDNNAHVRLLNSVGQPSEYRPQPFETDDGEVSSITRDDTMDRTELLDDVALGDTPQDDRRPAPRSFVRTAWSRLARVCDSIAGILAACERHIYPTLFVADDDDAMPSGEQEDGKPYRPRKKHRREFPLVFLLATAIGVVAVTTGIEARQLWTEHAAATNSVERYLATSLVLRIGAAMHETQLERGLASTFLGNRKKSRNALEKLQLQYHRTDKALCGVIEALLRHADVVAEVQTVSTEQSLPHEMAQLVAPIFRINGNRRRDSPTFGAHVAPANCLCLEKDDVSPDAQEDNATAPPSDGTKSSPSTHCSTCSRTFMLNRFSVDSYDCKSAHCRQLAAILLFLQSTVPSGGSSRQPPAPAPELPPLAASTGSGSRASSFEYYTGLNRNLLQLATNACVELVRNLRAGPSLAASLLYAYVNLAAFKEKAGIERGIISTELAFALTADQKSVLVRHRKAMANLHRKSHHSSLNDTARFADTKSVQSGKSATTYSESDTATNRTAEARSPSLSALVRLREVVAQQDVYLASFLAFATPAYVSDYARIRTESCVISSHDMRRTLIRRLLDIQLSLSAGGFFDYAPDLLDDAAHYVVPVPEVSNDVEPPLRRALAQLDPMPDASGQPTDSATSLRIGQAIAPTDTQSLQLQKNLRRVELEDDNPSLAPEADDEFEARLLSALREISENDMLWFLPQHWWDNQTCRINHLHSMSETLAIAIHEEAEKARRTLSIRAVRLAAPLLACFVATLLVGLRAIHAYIQYRDSTERRVKKLETRRLRYRDLLSRWAPLSSWMLDDDSHDDDSSNVSVTDDSSQSSTFDMNGAAPMRPGANDTSIEDATGDRESSRQGTTQTMTASSRLISDATAFRARAGIVAANITRSTTPPISSLGTLPSKRSLA